MFRIKFNEIALPISILFLSSCEIPSNLAQLSLSQNSSSRSHVSAISLSQDGALIVQGDRMDKVTALKMRSNGNTVSLSIISSTSGQLKAVAHSVLVLSAGTVYQLLISSVNADD